MTKTNWGRSFLKIMIVREKFHISHEKKKIVKKKLNPNDIKITNAQSVIPRYLLASYSSL